MRIETIIPIRGVNDENLGKKHALHNLINASSADYIWMMDDDVIPSPYINSNDGNIIEVTDREEIDCLGNADLIILPLKMESVNKTPSLLEKLQIAEYAAIQELTICTAQKGRAVMCSGANLLVRRNAWILCEPDLRPELPSGDDMFLLEAIKRRGMRLVVVDRPEFTAVVRPLTTWRSFFRQRMRWAGKAPHYKDQDIRKCGIWIVVLNFLQVLCPLILLIKFPIEYKMIKKRSATTHWMVALLLEVFYPFYMLISLLGGMIHPNRW